MRATLRVLIALVLVVFAEATSAEEVYQAPEQFLADTFGAHVPDPEVLWITSGLKETVRDIMGHPLGVLRVRYWGREGRTAWILEEIGKERPITTGIVVNQSRIESVRVLIYRESRGWEVRYPFFTNQFRDAYLTAEMELDRNIDGISGATLSVNALTRLARLALFLHQQTQHARE